MVCVLKTTTTSIQLYHRPENELKTRPRDTSEVLDEPERRLKDAKKGSL